MPTLKVRFFKYNFYHDQRLLFQHVSIKFPLRCNLSCLPIGTINIKDNDSLAARVAVEIGADLAILMSDVDGIYNKPPSKDEARIMHTFVPSDLKNIEFGGASDVGTGGMESKVKSALWALDHGVSVVICNGMQYNTIRKIYAGERTGSFFTNAEDVSVPVEVMAINGKIIAAL